MQPSSVCHMLGLWPIGIASSLMLPECGMPSPDVVTAESLDVLKKRLSAHDQGPSLNTLLSLYISGITLVLMLHIR